MTITSNKRALRDERRGPDSSTDQSTYRSTKGLAKAMPTRSFRAGGQVKDTSQTITRRAAFNDNRALDILLDQYYTNEDIAAYLYTVFCTYFDPVCYQMVEPTAGTGSFFK